MGHTSILPPCWVLRRPNGAGEPGLGVREWVEEPGKNWEWDPTAGAVKDDAPLVIQFAQYLCRVWSSSLLQSPRQHPAQQGDGGSRKEPWS